MTTVAHLADLHIGFSHLSARTESNRNQRQVDFEQAALAAADWIASNKPDVCVVAGDLLHDTNMYPAALAGAVSFCSTIQEAGVPLLAIGGNHDEAEVRNRYNGLRFLQDHAGLSLLGGGFVDIDDLRIHAVPYRVMSRASRGDGELPSFEFSDTRANLLLAHGYAPGEGVPVLPEGADVQIPDAWLRDKRFAACLLGHIHSHLEIAPRVFYAGSTERRNFGESGERPAFWLHEFQDGELASSKTIAVEDLSPDVPRPMIDILLDARDLSVRELDEKVLGIFDQENLGGVMMRIKLQGVSSEIDKRSAAHAWEREFKRREGLFFEAVVETRELAEALDITFQGPPQDIQKGFLDFLRESGAGGDLSPLAEEVMSEAKERLIAQEGD